MERLQKRICPDLTTLRDHLQIKNGYSNETERISFELNIVKCKKSEDVNCKLDREVI